MKENKSIDRLFQEKFKNLDVAPHDEVWGNIEERLKEKKEKRRIIPFWWKLSGVAAVFIVGFGLFNLFIDNNNINNSTNSNNEFGNENAVVKSDSKSGKQNTNTVDNQNSNSNKNQNNDIKKVDENSENLMSNSQNSIANSNDVSNEKDNSNDTDLKLNKKFKKSKSFSSATISDENLVENTASNKFNSKKEINKNGNQISINNNNSLAENEVLQQKNAIKNTNSVTNSDIKNNKVFDKNTIESVIENQQKSNEIVQNTIQNNTINSDNKIDEQKKLDSTSIASVVPNALEELLNEKEKQTSKERKLNRWQLTSNVAPIYFSSTSNGSPLDSKFKNNSKEYKTNISYGVGVNYAVTNKLKIRTGVNALSIDYNTNDVVFYQNQNARGIEHVTTNVQGSVIQIENKSTQIPPLEVSSSGAVLQKFNSSINQKIGYLEIPFELSYKIFDKKIGLNVIGGMSTLLLNQNEVSLMSSDVQMEIGKANNLNDIHFSTNIGLGFKYGFLKNLEARVEPVFKYQINTFTNDSGNFKPYFFGVYSGISYTF